MPHRINDVEIPELSELLELALAVNIVVNGKSVAEEVKRQGPHVLERLYLRILYRENEQLRKALKRKA